ncbi:unnamed protein product, partial [Ectocarpus fasciculatus]
MCDPEGPERDGSGEGELCLESQQLTTVPPSALSGSPHILHINLSRNALRSVPCEMYSLSGLVHLDLSRNHLAALPAGISRLGALRELNLLSNSLKMATLPAEELAGMAHLRVLDLRYNEKLQKKVAAATLRTMFGARLRLVEKGAAPATPTVRSACDRDCTRLADQLEPWSTPCLRQRLESVFGVSSDPETVGREELMQMLLRAYEARGPRQVTLIRQHAGTRVDPSLVRELTACLRALHWPTTTRERPKVQAQRYFTLQVPNTKFTVENGKKARLNASKLEKYKLLWDLILRVLRSVDPGYADVFTGVAVTMGFTDSPHIDTENIGPFYGISLGEFTGGGRVAVESSPLEVTHVDTFERLGRVDGRYPHWVTPYSGERYSIIYYRTVGETDPMGSAIFAQPEVGAPDPGSQ